ncbi:MAG: hypothetical protein HXS48_12550 [Theionarchaea archaeon]|nr:hypothetical protein [Theionarchaea archaeon]
MNQDSRPESSKKETIKYLSIVILLTLSFNLLSANISDFSLTSLRFLGFILLVIVLLALFPFSILAGFTLSTIRESKETRDNALIIVLVIAASILLFATSHRIFWMLSFCIFIFGLNTLSKFKVEKYISPILAGTLLYVFVFLLYLHNFYVYKGISSISFSFTESLGTLMKTPMVLGPSPSGFWIWLYFVLCIAALFIRNRSWLNLQKFILLVCGSFVMWVVSLVCYALVFSRIGIDLLSQVTLLQLVLCFMLSGLFFVGLTKVEFKPAEIKIYPRAWKRIAVLLLLFVSTIFLTAIPYLNQGSAGKIVFYERDSAMGSYVPEFPEEEEALTADRGISFGTMLWYFQEKGFTVEVLDGENSTSLQEALQNADVFIVANLTSSLSAEDCDHIQTFVKNGGGLLVFGEHTNMMASAVDFQAGRHYLNDILAVTGIRIKSDTAEWTHGHWQTSTEFAPHQIFRELTPDDIRTGSVGASLQVTGSAQPIMVGRYAFSDRENPLEPGYLGNREFDRGEQLGDIILAAVDHYGRGNILVFGDTSYGFNEALTGTWKLMENSLSFLTDVERSPYMGWIAFVFFIVTVFLLFGSDSAVRLTTYGVLFLALLISSAFSLTVDTPYQKVDTIAWIDTAHSNLLNIRGYQDNSVDGLAKNFMRNQYIPLFLNDINQLDEGKVFVIIAPTKGYSSGEVKKITTFVENGGLLLMSVGAAEKYAVKPLLNAFQMDIGDIPLGPVPWIIETHGRVPQISDEDLEMYWHEPKFMDAYPIGGRNLYKTYASLTYLGQTYNLIISMKYGKGLVVLIGDSRFLLNENLEYSLEPARLGKPVYAALWVGNVELLRDILTDFEEESS